jgi:hypothetical protein
MDPDDNGDYADHVEDLLGINHYPITVIEEGKETTFIFNTNDGDKLGSRRLVVNTIAIGCLDVDLMVQNVLSLIKNEFPDGVKSAIVKQYQVFLKWLAKQGYDNFKRDKKIIIRCLELYINYKHLRPYSESEYNGNVQIRAKI